MIITTHKDVYEPAEDTYLLINALRAQPDLSKLSVCDVGCGTGAVGLHAARQGATVMMLDANPFAVQTTKDNAAKNKLHCTVLLSDMFAAVPSGAQFDIITCNAPYLPADRREPDDYLTRSISGGKYGYEWSIEFLEQAKEFLQPKGVILLVVSSLSKPHVLQKHIARLGFDFVVAKEQGMGLGEYLYVFSNTFNDAVKNLRLQEYTDIYEIARGKRGVVYHAALSDRTYAVKCGLEDSYDAGQEADILRIVNKYNIGPKVESVIDGKLFMEYVAGPDLPSVLKTATFDQRCALLEQLFDQALLLDRIKINKKEFLRPYKNVIVNDGNIVLLDFERSRVSDKPRNVTQLAQYFTRAYKYPQDICTDITELSQAYMASYDESLGAKLKDLVLNTFKKIKNA